MKWIGFGLLVLILWRALDLYVRQRSFIFRPSKDDLGSPSRYDLLFDDFYLTCADQVKIHCWWIEGRQKEKAIIFFPGSVGNKTHELASIHVLSALSASLMVIDYPGYGKSEGRPSEGKCYRAAEAAWDFVTREKRFQGPDVILYGRSLGTAMVTYLAARHHCGGLVFHSGFTSIPDIASRLYPYLPVHLFCHTRMNSLKRIAQCNCSVLVFHSASDEFIPIRFADRIYARAKPPKRFVHFEGSHGGNQWHSDPKVRTALVELVAGRTNQWGPR
jgi:pimeloyl-ACP methyl ester carboxylesterase